MESAQIQAVTQHTPSLPPVKPTDWKYQVQQYGTAVFVAIPFATLFSLYSFYRSGSYNLATVNTVLADTAAILLGFVLLLGPLSRMFNLFDKYVQYRKELGVMVFWLTVAHALISFFFLLDTFSITTYLTDRFWPSLFGVAGLLMLTALFLSSRTKIKAKLGPQRWWKFQNWGVRLVLVFTALHLGITNMNKWVAWYQQGDHAVLGHPEWPHTSLLVGWFLAFVILIRVIEPLDKHWGTAAWYASCVLLPTIYIVTFIWGQQFVN